MRLQRRPDNHKFDTGFLDVRQVARHIGLMAKQKQSEQIDSIARGLVRRCRSATLATALRGRRQGWPYASLVTVACAVDASPILLMSTLADHTRNLIDDSRASLLFEEASSLPNPQTGPRVTITGRLIPTTDKDLARRFLARHPGAEQYAGFADFCFYGMKVERAHYVGGFGRAYWLSAKQFLFDRDASQTLAATETEILERLNREYGQTLSKLIEKPKKTTKKFWKAYGLDPEGLDLARNNTHRRIEFLNTVKTGRGVTSQVKKLAK